MLRKKTTIDLRTALERLLKRELPDKAFAGKILSKLSEEQKLYVWLHWGRGLTLKEIAAATGRPRRRVSYCTALAKKILVYHLGTQNIGAG